MVIHINPNRISGSSVSSGKSGNRRPQTPEQAEVVTPNRASVNFIPAPESLMTLIGSAVAALRRGTAWDRGTILNLLV